MFGGESGESSLVAGASEIVGNGEKNFFFVRAR